jgi:hypothetical protein
MNGRVYDPKIARFISADPTVQAPFNSQAHGRYSYVWNNPTSSVDPSGFKTEPDCSGCEEFIVPGQRTLEHLDPNLQFILGSGFDADVYNTSSVGSEEPAVGSGPLRVYIRHDATYYQTPPEQPSELTTLGRVHVGLSALSIGLDATGFGAAISWIPDLLDAGISLAEGDLPGAGLAAIAIVPFIGSVADAAKLTRVAARGSTKVLGDLSIAAGQRGAIGTVFKTSHYASRLEAAGVNVTRAESAVGKEVTAMRANMATNADVVGRLHVDDVLI